MGALVDRPSRTEQGLSTLRLCCELAGIYVGVNLHDLRRGLARDIVYLRNAPKPNVAEAASALGHDDATMRSGVTNDYIGPDKRDMYSERLQQQDLVEEPFGIGMIDAPFKRRKHTAPQDLKRVCEEHGLDYGNRNDRERATKLIRKQDMTALMEDHNVNHDEEQIDAVDLSNSGGSMKPLVQWNKHLTRSQVPRREFPARRSTSGIFRRSVLI